MVRDFLNFMNEVYGGNLIPLLFILALIYIFFRAKELRRILFWPSLLLILLLWNPILYEFLWKRILALASSTAVWRIFWVIPVLSVIGFACVHLVRSLKGPWMQGAAAAVFLAVIAFTGTYVYTAPETSFSTAENKYKIPTQTIYVAEALLQLDDAPRVVMDEGLIYYMREYSSAIHMMYGRDVFGYITWHGQQYQDVLEALRNINEENLQHVANRMRELDYEYLVINRNQGYDEEMFQKAGLVRASDALEFVICRLEEA